MDKNLKNIIWSLCFLHPCVLEKKVKVINPKNDNVDQKQGKIWQILKDFTFMVSKKKLILKEEICQLSLLNTCESKKKKKTSVIYSLFTWHI